MMRLRELKLSSNLFQLVSCTREAPSKLIVSCSIGLCEHVRFVVVVECAMQSFSSYYVEVRCDTQLVFRHFGGVP